MMQFFLVLVAALVAAEPPPPVTPPPVPDFKTLVDYRAWYNAQIAVAKANNAGDSYGSFLFAKKGDPVELLVPNPKSKVGKQLYNLMKHPRPWSSSDNPELAEWCERVEAQFMNAFNEGVKRPHLAPRPTSDIVLLSEIKPPRLELARAVGQVMLARGWRVEGHAFYTDNIINALRDNLIFANHVAEVPGIETQLFASAHHRAVYSQFRGALRSRTTDLEVFRDLRQALDAADTVPVTTYFQRDLYFEEAAALQLLQHLYTSYEENDKKIRRLPQDRTVEAFFMSRFPDASKRPRGWDTLKEMPGPDMAQRVHGYYEDMRGVLASPPADLRARLDEIEAKYLKDKPAMELLVTPVDLLTTSILETEAERRMARLYLEMATTYKDAQKWPESIDQLNFPRLAECRIDPFTGKDFLMHPVQTRYALYSVGADGKDDGCDEGKDLVFFATVPLDETVEAAPPGAIPATADSNGAPPAEGGNPATAPAASPAPKSGG